MELPINLPSEWRNRSRDGNVSNVEEPPTNCAEFLLLRCEQRPTNQVERADSQNITALWLNGYRELLCGHCGLSADDVSKLPVEETEADNVD